MCDASTSSSASEITARAKRSPSRAPAAAGLRGLTAFEWVADPALEFAQRFTGAFDADGTTITGRWEISRDGSHWEHDFDLVYTRSGVEPVA
jgi:hypothetical protein